MIYSYFVIHSRLVNTVAGKEGGRDLFEMDRLVKIIIIERGNQRSERERSI